MTGSKGSREEGHSTQGDNCGKVEVEQGGGASDAGWQLWLGRGGSGRVGGRDGTTRSRGSERRASTAASVIGRGLIFNFFFENNRSRQTAKSKFRAEIFFPKYTSAPIYIHTHIYLHACITHSF